MAIINMALVFSVTLLYISAVLTSATEVDANRVIQEDSTNIEERFLALSERLGLLESRDRAQKIVIERLESRDRIHQAALVRLESRDQQHQQEIQALKTELQAVKQRSVTQEKMARRRKTVETGDHVQYKRSARADYTAEVPDNTGMVPPIAPRIRRVENELTIAFYATLGKHIVHTGVNQNIVFEQVVTNIGGAYSNTLGVFQAPVKGTYVFSTTLMVLGHNTEHYSLCKNGHTVAYMYGRAVESAYTVTGQTATLYLQKGDNVEIRTVDADGSAHGGTYSSFTGFLLQQDYDEATTIVGK